MGNTVKITKPFNATMSELILVNEFKPIAMMRMIFSPLRL